MIQVQILKKRQSYSTHEDQDFRKEKRSGRRMRTQIKKIKVWRNEEQTFSTNDYG